MLGELTRKESFITGMETSGGVLGPSLNLLMVVEFVTLPVRRPPPIKLTT